jgi:uncharacterized lipoprotein YddW (UPF0748 family)
LVLSYKNLNIAKLTEDAHNYINIVSNPMTFSDIQSHWSRPFIEALARWRILSGYPDGTCRPDNPVTRAEFAAIIASVFTQPVKREYVPFVDVPQAHWAINAIKKVYETGFLTGYPNKRFGVDESIARGDALVAMVNGLSPILAGKVDPDLVSKLPEIYEDASLIPYYGINQIALATHLGWVVSYPTGKILNYKIDATRADVAVMVYQALVYLGKAEKIPSDYLVIPPTLNKQKPAPTNNTVKVNHHREFRGAWVASVWNSDWPSKPGLPVEQQKAELVAIIKQLQSLNFNALVLQVRPEGDALYASELEPWSAWITGTQGKAPTPFYDPLELAISECHKRNIELHAWFNPYRARANSQVSPVRPHIAVTNPEVVYQWGSQQWMDPGAKIVQDRAYNVIIDVVSRYDLDAIHLDDYFYPYPISGKPFPDNKTYAAYQRSGGKLNLEDWRRENVNQMVLRLSQGIKAAKPHVKFGISPFGIYRSGEPAGIVGLDAYSVLYADSKKWLQQGWIDYIAPQLYWRTDQTKQSYQALLKWWTEINIKQRHVYAGNNLGQLDGKEWKNSEIAKQIQISRNLAANLSLGNIFFSMTGIKENRQGIADQFKTYYPSPALIPSMSWQTSITLRPPKNLKFVDGKLNWEPGDNQAVRSWTLYLQNGNNWIIQRILSAGTTFATVSPGNYAICAVDRLGYESEGVMITVT